MFKILVCLSIAFVIVSTEEIDHHAHPKYNFEYGVHDPHTKDIKKQWESRNGDEVQGSYSLKEADGTVRIVDYHANDRTGFNAVVRREGHAVHPEVNTHKGTHSFEHQEQAELHHPQFVTEQDFVSQGI